MDPMESGGQGSAPVDTGSQGTVAESQVTESVVESQDSGNGFYDQYLQEVPDEVRPTVQTVLEQYRREQDANFNRRFEQVREESKVPVTIYESLLENPVETVKWIADRFNEERGVDLRQQLLQEWADAQQVQSEEGQGQQTDQPLTAAEVEKILEQREKQQRAAQQDAVRRQQQMHKQQQTVNSWIKDAAGKFGLDLQAEDPLIPSIIVQANQLHESGKAQGQAAVEMVVEALSKRFGTTPNGGGGNAPKVAEGGNPPPAKDINVADKNQRRARMLELFPNS